jgi:transcriptional regulator with XRE-family HTH domain
MEAVDRRLRFAGVMDSTPDVDARKLAGAILRSARAHAGLSQRELAAKVGVARSTIGRAEGSRGPAPGWALIVRAVAACGCSMSITPAESTMRGLGSWRWDFEGVRDRAARHLPAHLEVWPVLRASAWSSFHKYSCFANPPVPLYSYTMRRRRR